MYTAIFTSCLLGYALVTAEDGPQVELVHLTDLSTATDGDYVSGGEIRQAFIITKNERGGRFFTTK